jgi:hypothetical protein
MAFVLWLGAAALLIISVALGRDDAPFIMRFVAGAAGWVGLPVLLLAVGYSARARLWAALRGQLVKLEGSALVRAMPPRVVLDALLAKTLGNGHGLQEIITALLGGPGRDASVGDTVVSRGTSVHFRIESVTDTECITYLTVTHEYSGVRNNHKFVIFATSDREIASLVLTDRIYPLYEVWLVEEEILEDFVPALQESLRVGVTYSDSSGVQHAVEPKPQRGEEVAFRHYDQYLRLPEHIDRKNLRIVQLDLHDLADEDHVVKAIETLTVRASNVATFDLGYVVWSPPHPCFVHSVTFDVSGLGRPGLNLVHLVMLSTIKGAGLPMNRWQPVQGRIEVPVDSWMLSGHNVTLLYRPTSSAESPDAARPDRSL